ncbi:MAG TPA: hemerythrin domain-containing protein [Vicinamibacterales bacterium]|nr:hemerythrin domain-containing protein [Vicinamibacterales bacterium]
MSFVDILLEEHRQFATMLGVLEALARRVAAGDEVPLDVLSDVLEFFDRFAAQHHDREEQLLFPFLAGHGIGPDQTAVHALRAQHEAGRVYNAKLRGEFRQLAAGEAGAAAALAQTLGAFSELIREHLRIEDEYFYALADQVLTPAEHERILRQLERAANDPAARQARQRYLRMLATYPAMVAAWDPGH